ncbi:hypothetical protein BZG36_04413 [Bifiguratus adelaidae]|uniref:RING-type domain-containing protein n=1 Tax=Bifiguratus adelaidae TaxID=1938954 RepID=A0A261XWN9_9FUNG|nr:hypothetical protein BZG36_04413 [Bifiguratus adelaidae]
MPTIYVDDSNFELCNGDQYSSFANSNAVQLLSFFYVLGVYIGTLLLFILCHQQISSYGWDMRRWNRHHNAIVELFEPEQESSYRRRRNPSNLTLSMLNDRCPSQTWHAIANTSANKECYICYEDFVHLEEEDQGDTLRRLPCGHSFCSGCIDAWLTQKSTLCPTCKYDCLLDRPYNESLVGSQQEADNDQFRVSIDLEGHAPMQVDCNVR